LAQDPSSNGVVEDTLLSILGVTSCDDSRLDYCRENITCAVTEMAIIYNQRLPYTTVPGINGDCIVFSDDFIYLVRYAMSTDCLLYMSPSELEMWNDFVTFENTGFSNLWAASDALDDLLVDLVMCEQGETVNTPCSTACGEDGYLVPVDGETCEGTSIIPLPIPN